jgi:hypothetical protein
VSDAEALAAAQQVAQRSSSSTTWASEAASSSTPEADALGNEQMVWEMLYNPAYSLSTIEAEAAWHRAMGKIDDEPEAVRLLKDAERREIFTDTAMYLHVLLLLAGQG